MFDAAIHILRGELFCDTPGNEDYDEQSDHWERWQAAHKQEKWQELMMAAIRVLEAAGKVSERDLGRVFMGFVSAELRELLEAIKSANAALPDAPKEASRE